MHNGRVVGGRNRIIREKVAYWPCRHVKFVTIYRNKRIKHVYNGVSPFYKATPVAANKQNHLGLSCIVAPLQIIVNSHVIIHVTASLRAVVVDNNV